MVYFFLCFWSLLSFGSLSFSLAHNVQENCVNEECEERMFIVAPELNPEELVKPYAFHRERELWIPMTELLHSLVVKPDGASSLSHKRLGITVARQL